MDSSKSMTLTRDRQILLSRTMRVTKEGIRPQDSGGFFLPFFHYFERDDNFLLIIAECYDFGPRFEEVVNEANDPGFRIWK